MRARRITRRGDAKVVGLSWMGGVRMEHAAMSNFTNVVLNEIMTKGSFLSACFLIALVALVAGMYLAKW
jgi:hypothetical protein